MLRETFQTTNEALPLLTGAEGLRARSIPDTHIISVAPISSLLQKVGAHTPVFLEILRFLSPLTQSNACLVWGINDPLILHGLISEWPIYEQITVMCQPYRIRWYHGIRFPVIYNPFIRSEFSEENKLTLRILDQYKEIHNDRYRKTNETPANNTVTEQLALVRYSNELCTQANNRKIKTLTCLLLEANRAQCYLFNSPILHAALKLFYIFSMLCLEVIAMVNFYFGASSQRCAMTDLYTLSFAFNGSFPGWYIIPKSDKSFSGNFICQGNAASVYGLFLQNTAYICAINDPQNTYSWSSGIALYLSIDRIFKTFYATIFKCIWEQDGWGAHLKPECRGSLADDLARNLTNALVNNISNWICGNPPLQLRNQTVVQGAAQFFLDQYQVGLSCSTASISTCTEAPNLLMVWMGSAVFGLTAGFIVTLLMLRFCAGMPVFSAISNWLHTQWNILCDIDSNGRQNTILTLPSIDHARPRTEQQAQCAETWEQTRAVRLFAVAKERGGQRASTHVRTHIDTSGPR